MVGKVSFQGCGGLLEAAGTELCESYVGTQPFGGAGIETSGLVEVPLCSVGPTDQIERIGHPSESLVVARVERDSALQVGDGRAVLLHEELLFRSELKGARRGMFHCLLQVQH